MYYAQKQFVVTAKRVEEDGWLKTENGDFPTKKGDIILTDYNGHSFLTTEYFFKEDYIPVKLIDKEIDIEKMASAYAEMSELNQEEDEDYIKGLKDNINKDN